MITSLTSLFKLYILSTGRRIFALRQVRTQLEAAEQSALKDAQSSSLQTAIDKAIAHDIELLGLEKDQGQQNAAIARKLDGQIDRALTIIARMLEHLAADTTEQETSSLAADLSDALFPNGVKSHIHLPYLDQLAANERVVDTLTAEDNSGFVNRVGLGFLAERVSTLNKPFAEAVKGQSEHVDWVDIKARRDQGQELYLHAVAHIAALPDSEVRDALLVPILAQNREVLQFRRRRRRSVDVDPDTGEPLAGYSDEQRDEQPIDTDKLDNE